MIRYGVVEQARTRALRRTVLRPQLGPGEPLPGDERPDAVHLGAIAEDGSVLCTCFVYPDPCPWLPDRPAAWHLRQMATAPERRGEGLGAGVVAAAAGYVREHGGTLVWCHARESAGGFYARQGFTVHGEVFTDAEHTIPHLRMWLELPAAATSSG